MLGGFGRNGPGPVLMSRNGVTALTTPCRPRREQPGPPNRAHARGSGTSRWCRGGPGHRRDDDRGEGKGMGERIVKMTGGQSAPDSDIDPEDGRQGNPERDHDARHPVPELAPGDHDQPQRGQGQQVKRLPCSGFILGQAARVVHSMVSIGVRARPVVVVIHGHQRSTGLASRPSTSGHPRAGLVVSVSAGTGWDRGKFLAAYALRACHVRRVRQLLALATRAPRPQEHPGEREHTVGSGLGRDRVAALTSLGTDLAFASNAL